MPDQENIIFGINPVWEKIKASAEQVLEILIAENAQGGALRQLIREAGRQGVRITPVQTKILERLAGGYRHQGVVARVEAYGYLSFGELLHQVSDDTAMSWILALDGLTDPRNFGALLRTAEAAGVAHVIIPKDRSVSVTPVVVKASAGATHHLGISKVTNLRRTIGELKNRGYWTVGLDGQSSQSIYDKSFPHRLVILLGGEGKGLRPTILRECDFVVSIPMHGRIASLNVGVAGAIFLYELVRQHRIQDKC